MPTEPPTTTPPPPAGPSGLELALAAREAGEAAATAATQAVADATKYSAMLTAVANKGDSAMTGENAQKVLDARSSLEAAIMDAEDAVEAAEEAMTAAEGDEALVAALDAAIKAANAQIKAAKTTLASNELAMLTRMVTGAPTDAGYPKAAADKAKEIAKAINTALTTSAQLLPGSTRATAAQMAAGNEADNSKGVGWVALIEQLGLPIRGTRVNRITGGSPDTTRPTVFVNGAVVNGLDAPTEDNTGTALVTPIGRTQGDSAGVLVTMFGLPGTLYCQVGTCTVTDDGKLSGAAFEYDDPVSGETLTLTPRWFFVPADATNDRYVADSASPGEYKVETGYVNYGYWISVDTSGATPVDVVNTYAAIVGDHNGGSLDLTFPSGTKSATATYSGSALGIASRQSGIESGKPTYASGEFTADVTLMATFGATATLGGKVSNFRGGVADSRWSATLGATALSGTAGITGGTATGDTGETAGAWTAQGYGAATGAPRPAGFFGTFNANFTNGSAAGGYAATRDKN